MIPRKYRAPSAVEEDPEHPGDADAAAGQKHGHQHIAGTAECSGKNLNKDKGRIGGNNDVKDFKADGKHFCVRGKEGEQELSKEKVHQ